MSSKTANVVMAMLVCCVVVNCVCGQSQPCSPYAPANCTFTGNISCNWTISDGNVEFKSNDCDTWLALHGIGHLNSRLGCSTNNETHCFTFNYQFQEYSHLTLHTAVTQFEGEKKTFANCSISKGNGNSSWSKFQLSFKTSSEFIITINATGEGEHVNVDDLEYFNVSCENVTTTKPESKLTNGVCTSPITTTLSPPTTNAAVKTHTSSPTVNQTQTISINTGPIVTGPIVGAVVGAAILVALCVVIITLYRKRRLQCCSGRKSQSSYENPIQTPEMEEAGASTNNATSHHFHESYKYAVVNKARSKKPNNTANGNPNDTVAVDDDYNHQNVKVNGKNGVGCGANAARRGSEPAGDYSEIELSDDAGNSHVKINETTSVYHTPAGTTSNYHTPNDTDDDYHLPDDGQTEQDACYVTKNVYHILENDPEGGPNDEAPRSVYHFPATGKVSSANTNDYNTLDFDKKGGSQKSAVRVNIDGKVDVYNHLKDDDAYNAMNRDVNKTEVIDDDYSQIRQ